MECGKPRARKSGKPVKFSVLHEKVYMPCLSNIGKGKKHKWNNKIIVVKIVEKLQTSAKLNRLFPKLSQEKCFFVKLVTSGKPLVSIVPKKYIPR